MEQSTAAKELRNLLVNLENSTRSTIVEVEAAFKVFAQRVFQLNFKFKHNDFSFQIAEIEFASTALEDVFHKHEHQYDLGLFYVHRHKGSHDGFHKKRAGFDITCGSSGAPSTILIRGIRVSGTEIKGANTVLSKIVDEICEPIIEDGKVDKKKTFRSLENLSLFESFSISEIENYIEVTQDLRFEKRITIKSNKFSDALLMATNFKALGRVKNPLFLNVIKGSSYLNSNLAQIEIIQKEGNSVIQADSKIIKEHCFDSTVVDVNNSKNQMIGMNKKDNLFTNALGPEWPEWVKYFIFTKYEESAFKKLCKLYPDFTKSRESFNSLDINEFKNGIGLITINALKEVRIRSLAVQVPQFDDLIPEDERATWHKKYILADGRY